MSHTTSFPAIDEGIKHTGVQSIFAFPLTDVHEDAPYSSVSPGQRYSGIVEMCPTIVQLTYLTLFVTHITTLCGGSTSPSWDNCYGRHCEVGEYCGLNEPFRSCRPCTVVAVWCNNTKYVEENFFPCLQICKILSLELQASQLSNEIRELQKKEGTEGTDIILKVAAGIMAGMVFGAVVAFCTTRVRRRREDNLPLQTATASGRRSGVRALWDKLLGSMRWPRHSPQSPVSCMNSDVGYTVVGPPPDVENQSGGDCLQSSNRIVIPNCGIAHDAQDTQDFIFSSVS